MKLKKGKGWHALVRAYCQPVTNLHFAPSFSYRLRPNRAGYQMNGITNVEKKFTACDLN